MMVKINPEFAAKYLHREEPMQKAKPIPTLGRLDKITYPLFEKIFAKALMSIGARNALALLELPSRKR